MNRPDAFAPGPETGYRPRRERPIAVLIAELANELRRLLRLEAALFKAELAEKMRRVGRGVVAVGIGIVFALGGWMALLATAAIALAIVLPAWLAALIVGVVALLIGVVMLYLGKRWLDAQALAPRRTLNSLREDEAWRRERVP